MVRRRLCRAGCTPVNDAIVDDRIIVNKTAVLPALARFVELNVLSGAINAAIKSKFDIVPPDLVSPSLRLALHESHGDAPQFPKPPRMIC
jgi:hypothetical protein